MKSLKGVELTLTLKINNNVNSKRRILTPNLKVSMLIEIKIKIPHGTPTILPKINLFNSIKSMSCLIFKISDTEIIKDKIMFICIASCGRNNINKNGVAIIEKPKPEHVCKIEATKIMPIKINIVPKIDLLFPKKISYPAYILCIA